uniref:Uncharacterized protein n=1 Tax=Anguilla anguilla TaxID=7936 RepID=A0A0E9VR26_ANGAN
MNCGTILIKCYSELITLFLLSTKK